VFLLFTFFPRIFQQLEVVISSTLYIVHVIKDTSNKTIVNGIMVLSSVELLPFVKLYF